MFYLSLVLKIIIIKRIFVKNDNHAQQTIYSTRSVTIHSNEESKYISKKYIIQRTTVELNISQTRGKKDELRLRVTMRKNKTTPL